jgi:flagellar basal-body rod protein FlgG
MNDALYIAAAGMRAHQAEVDAISHNVANISTPGFKRERVDYAAVSSAIVATSEADSADVVAAAVAPEASRGAGTVASTRISMLAGELRNTGEPLDVAIDGTGFLEVVRADGSPAYTRAGSLKLDANGQLTLADGTPLASRVDVSPDTKQIFIDTDGRVRAVVGDSSAPAEIGRFDIVSFANPEGLESIGNNLYAPTAESGQAQVGSPGENGLGVLRQGYVESSNVQLTDELVSLMVAQRGFEMSSRVAQAADQMLAITNSLYR